MSMPDGGGAEDLDALVQRLQETADSWPEEPIQRGDGVAAAEAGYSEPTICVSLTTIPPRMAGINRCLNSLVNQTLLPARIFLCVPERYRRFETPEAIPFDLSRYEGRVELVRCPEDYGPGTKLIGCLERLPARPDTLLVLVDDDLVYRPHMLQTFADYFAAAPSSAASFFTYDYRGIRVGQGADGFALPAARLNALQAFHHQVQACPAAFFVDDLWISYFLWLHGVPIADLSSRSQGGIFEIYNDVAALNRESGPLSRKRVMRSTIWYLHRKFGMRELARRTLERARL